jgi:hypothetical protein
MSARDFASPPKICRHYHLTKEIKEDMNIYHGQQWLFLSFTGSTFFFGHAAQH